MGNRAKNANKLNTKRQRYYMYTYGEIMLPKKKDEAKWKKNHKTISERIMELQAEERKANQIRRNFRFGRKYKQSFVN